MNRCMCVLGCMGAVLLTTSYSRAAASLQYGPAFPIVEDGRAQAVIVLGTEATLTERHAASELAKYIREMTGATLRTRRVARGQDIGHWSSVIGHMILIGRAETNPLIKQLVDEGVVRLSADEPGLDGYVIQTVGNDGRWTLDDGRVLVLGGSRDRGTLYAVYDLLARFAHVGFFWDAERIPKLDSFAIPDVAIAERPFFRDRLVLNSAWGYTLWVARTIEDWKRNINWAAKNRFNQILLYAWPQLPQLFWKRLNARMAIAPEPVPTAEEEAEVEFYHQILRYIRSLDLEAVPTVLPGTDADEAFRQAFPEARYIQTQWPIPGYPPTIKIHPADPVYRRYVRTAIEVWREMFPESGHQYFGGEMYAELRVELSDQEIDELVTDLFKTQIEAMVEADPEGVWQTSGWNFLDSSLWTARRMESLFSSLRLGSGQALPVDQHILIWDLACDSMPLYQTDRANYWYGAPWMFGVIHSYGGDDQLHGDLADTLQRTRAVASDPKAGNCVGFAITTEMFGYCMLYYDFLGRIAWDPRAVTVDTYLADCALRRYGEEAGPGLTPDLKELAQTVYGSLGGSRALHQRRLYLEDYWGAHSPPEAKHVAEVLGNVLRAMLDRADLLGGEKVYLDDLVDFTRQYLTEIADAHRQLLDHAFMEGDRQGFEAETRILDELLDALERLVSTRPEYRVLDVYEHQAQSPIYPKDGGRDIRDNGLTFAVSIPGIIDYQNKDMYELLKFYYRPRIRAYEDYLRQRMMAGETTADRDELTALYRPIEVRWVEEGYDPEQAKFAAADTAVEACRAALDLGAEALGMLPEAVAAGPPKGYEGLNNIAIGRCVEASSMYGADYSLSSVADGGVSWGRGWASAADRGADQWLLFDLGEPREVHAIQYSIEPDSVGAAGSRYCRDYKVDVSDDGKVWRTVAEGTFPPGATTPGESLPVIAIDPPVKARYLKFRMLDSYAGNIVVVGELAIWGR